MMTAQEPRMSTGVAGLDDMLRGGLRRGDSTLVAGSPGTGKTTLGIQFIAEGARRGEPGVFVTFEYLPQQIYADAERRGIPLMRWEDEGLVRVVCTTPDLLSTPTPEGLTLLREAVAEVGAKRLVIDSVTHFRHDDSRVADDLRKNIAGLLNHLRLIGVTAILTHEVPQIVGPTVRLSDWGLEFLVDNVIMLRYVELDGELQKAASILKFRAGDHDRHYRVLNLSDEGMTVNASFSGVENISGGAARRGITKRAEDIV